mgnify:FL=1|tara:strand:- start:86 stop:499 length:414 start_codon:yes stop_codon:yes gene_type:complete
MQLISRVIRHLGPRTSNTSKKVAVGMLVGMLAEPIIKVVNRHETEPTKRRGLTGVKVVNPCINPRVPGLEMKQMEANPSPNLTDNSTSKKDPSKTTIRKTSLTRSMGIVTIISRIVIENKVVMTSSRIKIRVWAECL